jgi:hypothetical protein
MSVSEKRGRIKVDFGTGKSPGEGCPVLLRSGRRAFLQIIY